MTLADRLGYAHARQNALRRWIVAVASTPAVSRVNDRVLAPVDRFVLRLTGGRWTVSSVASGVPVIWLTSTGARSGAMRTVPLLAFPVGDGLGLLGTRFGQESTPGWVHNLESDPRAWVTYRGSVQTVRARPAEPEEATVVWATAAKVYPGYSEYAKRASHRRIRVMVLEAEQ
jgi:deazaflavin-dependent oxidoreductase (nitroreductase family)